MKRGILANTAGVVACIGLVCPPVAKAAEPSIPAVARSVDGQRTVYDVELGHDGLLNGVCLDAAGNKVSSCEVRIAQQGKLVAMTKCDRDGRFSFRGLRGGVYQVATRDSNEIVRVWAADTAPPAAANALSLAPRENVVRGQQRIRDVFRSDAFIVTSIIAAAIAIPVIVHNSRDRDSEDDSSS